ncbi:uncharacterized protein LOC132053931 [Lycium ferocissimum]|uniref:uncharacterized protein LOC132053931 n=1 Tax=Lycium ferocissimum TaxID=112874 RepID=UPI002815CC10|nr:uncharacterized protein LOC132053931 [Lycium ferocissimum]
MPYIICESQSGFILGRRIFDNIILAHELVKAYTRKHISAKCMIKIDMQKAYDSMEWVYMEQILEMLGFPTRFRGWLMQCVTTVNYTNLVNGTPTTPFDAAKGLRQGDPISPFLFAIVMEYLSRNLNTLKFDKAFKFHPKCARLGITHLSFTDDLLLFSRGDLNSSAALHKAFITFSQASDLQANLNKSSVYFGGVTTIVQDDILQHLGYTTGITKRVTSWIAKKLSYARRVHLVQSVLFGIQAYWAQLFILPVKVVKALEAYCRSYVWSGINTITKKALVSWEKVCTPKASGGPNLTNLQMWNHAAIIKLCWDLASKQDRLWIKWIHAYYVKNQEFATMVIPGHASWMVIWKGLIKWALDEEPLCILCQQRHEDRNHLFVGCTFAIQLWSRLFSWIQRQFSPAQTWENHLTWAIKDSFEKRSRDVPSIAREIAYICNVRARAGLSSTIQSYQF